MDAASVARHVAEEYLRACNEHDINKMVTLWEPGGIERFPTFDQAFSVPDGFAAHFRSLFVAFPDVHWDILSLTQDDERVVVRSLMQGTHLGPYQGLEATGKCVAVDTIDFLHITDGRIVQNDVFFDGLTVLRQIGAMPPAGSKRERTLQTAFNLSTAVTSKRMILGEATITIRRPAKEILEFVLDLDKYREADHKFLRIHYVERLNNHGVAK